MTTEEILARDRLVVLREIAGRRIDEAGRALVRETVNTDVEEPFGAYIFTADEPGSAIARNLERAVFLEAFGNTPAQLDVEYGPYESSSLFFCVVDHRRAIVAGMVRMIIPTPHGPGLKSLVDVEPVWGRPGAELLAESGIDVAPDRAWDSATLAVGDEYRMAAALGLVNLGLFQSFVRTGLRVGAEDYVTILDFVAFRLLRTRAHFPFIKIAEGRPYLGSRSSIPCYFSLSDWRARLERVDRERLGIIFEGHGVEEALRPLDLERAASCVRRTMSAGTSAVAG